MQAEPRLSMLRAPTSLRRRCLPWWLASACLLLFAGCGCAFATPLQAAMTPVPEVQAWPPLDAGCSVLEPGFTSPQGQFRVLECQSGTVAMQQPDDASPVELRFQHLGPGGEITETYALDREGHAAIVKDTLVPGFWGGHVLTLLLEQESGALWMIGNWTGSAFVLTPYRYATGNEGGFEATWYDDGFTVTTESDGQWRVVTGGPDSSPGTFANESVACSLDSNGIRHELRLGLETNGSIRALTYSSAIHAEDGIHQACLIQDARGGSSAWKRLGNDNVIVDIPGATIAIPGSHIRIYPHEVDAEQAEAAGGRADPSQTTYNVVLNVFAPSFCDRSDAIAAEVVLKADAARCVSVDMPKPATKDVPMTTSWTAAAIRAAGHSSLATPATAGVVARVSVPGRAGATDIVDWFNDYYRFAAADFDAHPERYLPVVESALDDHATAEAVLGNPAVARVEALDPAVGYLAIGGANDASELTMATYRSHDGREILVVDSTICVDDCDMHVEVFARDASGHLVLMPTMKVFPEIPASEFLVPDEKMPTQFSGATPSFRHRPLPNGRDIEVSIWFGASAEDEHLRWAPDDDGIMGTVTLQWDAKLGKFVRP